MTPRSRRLISDLRLMEQLSQQGTVSYRTEGSPPETYHLMLNVAGPAVKDDHLVVRHVHRCTAYLHRDYPRRPPLLVWMTPVFHPNLLGPDRNGGVCIGSWSASESLADLTVRLIDLLTLRSFNLDDALDTDAAHWFRDNSLEPGLDLDRLVGLEVDRSQIKLTEVR